MRIIIFSLLFFLLIISFSSACINFYESPEVKGQLSEGLNYFHTSDEECTVKAEKHGLAYEYIFAENNDCTINKEEYAALQRAIEEGSTLTIQEEEEYRQFKIESKSEQRKAFMKSFNRHKAKKKTGIYCQDTRYTKIHEREGKFTISEETNSLRFMKLTLGCMNKNLGC